MGWWLEGLRRRSTWPVVVTLLTLSVAVPALVFSCGYVLSDPAGYVAAADQLAIPEGWRLDHTDVDRNFILGSRVTRYYLVDATPDQLMGPVQATLEAAGYEISYYGSGPCVTNGRNGPTTCHLTGNRASNDIGIDIFDRGETISEYAHATPRAVGAPGFCVLRVSVPWFRR